MYCAFSELYLLHSVHIALAANHFAKDRVLAVQPRRRHGGNVELAAVRVRSLVGHGQESRSRVIDRHVLVVKVFAINAHRAMAIARHDVTTCTTDDI